MIYRINKQVLLEEASAVKTINKHDKIVAAVGLTSLAAAGAIGYGKYKDAKRSDAIHGQEQLDNYIKSKKDAETTDNNKQEETAIDAKEHSQDETI